MTNFTGWVTEMFTFCKNGYTVAMAFATKIVEIQWLPLTKIGFLMQWMRVILNEVVHVHGENIMVEKLAGHSRLHISSPVLCSRK
jgi:hypothetical protein